MFSAQLFFISFFGLAAVWFGIVVFRTFSMMRSALALLFFQTALGAMFLSMEAEFLGVLQIMMMATEMSIMVMFMMGVELMLAAAMVNLLAFWRYLHPDNPVGQMFILIIMTVMALEMAVGFGIAIARFRVKGSIEMEEATELKG